MRTIEIHQARHLVFGDYCFNDFINYFILQGFREVIVIADPNIGSVLEKLSEAFSNAGINYFISKEVTGEPTLSKFKELLEYAEKLGVDSVIGIGGGSVLDVAKLMSVMVYSGKTPESLIGQGKVEGRKVFLACLPTTSGTGSEVSPNAIFLDEKDNLKKAVISSYLVPDVTYIDPVLTHSVPPSVTASTGIDALTHCIEAFVNKNAHPLIDLYALQGIKLIFENLEKVFKDGTNAEARAKVALGSMYGGMCLGPVNTAAVHALAYPLGSKYHIPHGISNAILLSSVLKINLNEGIEKYAEIAKIIGVFSSGRSKLEIAREGIAKIEQLCQAIGIPSKLTEFNIPLTDVPELAKSAYSVRRLLDNNIHDFTLSEIEELYYNLF